MAVQTTIEKYTNEAQTLRAVRGTYENARRVIAVLNMARRGVSAGVIGSLMNASPRAIRDVIMEARRCGQIPKDADKERGRWVVSTHWHDRDVTRWVHTALLFRILDDLTRTAGLPKSDLEQCEAYEHAYDIYLTIIRQIHNGEPQQAPGYLSFSRFLGSLRLRKSGLIAERKCRACHDVFLDDATSKRGECYFCTKIKAHFCAKCGSPLEDKDYGNNGICHTCR